MKKTMKKASKKLVLNKLTVSNMNSFSDIKGGLLPTYDCGPTSVDISFCCTQGYTRCQVCTWGFTYFDSCSVITNCQPYTQGGCTSGNDACILGQK